MTETLNLTEATPAEIDAVLFPLWAERWFQAETIYTTSRNVAASLFPGSITEPDRRYGRKAVGAYYGTSEHSYSGSFAEALRRGDAKLVAALDALETVKGRIVEIDAEFERRGGWTRYTLVRGGHLHKAGCSTVRWNTPTYLLAEASGLTDAEVVDRYDFTACTHCFPEAPVLTDAEKLARSGACPGSGRYVEVTGRYPRYAKCPECNETVNRTQRGLLRKHKAVTA